MRNQQPQDSIGTIELSPGIEIQALISQEHIPALRAGFALFPANPRWSALKFQAWKSGRRLRQALERGETYVGDRHLTLVATEPQVEKPAPRQPIEACLSAVKRLLGERSYAGL
ncbi:hypothetical protein IQ235_05065 [Oscillatoriales cyanobacterium LEGE 11467]|uniref:Uncharacterized protein n=1 Tax=Zarconia navalis LEGE 11467 TaxID=1828826 RepID=A0A928VU26_9CYAN|nr:hypothetical protein [Zarconia navalis]MBE9040161.1 hypothetical protein [Zarconia navalis LEGE 11467]